MDYPEALVEKVAFAMFDAQTVGRGIGGQTLGPPPEIWYTLANAALDAIGLQEDRRTVVLAGNDTPVKAKPGKWLRYTTGWEAIRD
ncbi:hypothetical protein SAMN05428970_1999 [Agromyces sp. CF514]|uniref:hypothetical protein n=1 Tax=Agromyces sp. CF514 TaxID=1881031 RepID=UPI0008DF68EE|nr:hypothetical protein [Agromyces sp. CF514]SFR75987.1 hypothetical protein SAMN05428970_1999 [Agromyces sp. CF514]